MKSHSKTRNWRSRMPYIIDMMKIMTDDQIARQYNIATSEFRKTRKRYGAYRKDEEKPAIISYSKSLPIQWDFRGDNLV